MASFTGSFCVDRLVVLREKQISELGSEIASHCGRSDTNKLEIICRIGLFGFSILLISSIMKGGRRARVEFVINVNGGMLMLMQP